MFVTIPTFTIFNKIKVVVRLCGQLAGHECAAARPYHEIETLVPNSSVKRALVIWAFFCHYGLGLSFFAWDLRLHPVNFGTRVTRPSGVNSPPHESHRGTFCAPRSEEHTSE